MPLIDIQRRLVEVGRIRLGERQGNRPVKRDTFRLTSRDRARLEAAQSIYPGELRAWDDQWELLTETDELRIMVIPGQPLSQWYEMWSGGGCQRRCDGQQMVTPADGPCQCPTDPDERATLAQKGQACKPTSRLSVMLPDVPGIGCWRLESHGYYAAVELAGMADRLAHVSALGVMLPARLRIDQRTSIKGGQTRKYPVPVIDIEATPLEVEALAAPEGATPLALPSGQPLPDEPRAAQATDGASSSSDATGTGADSPDAHAADRSQQPDVAAVGDESAPMLTDGERRYIFRLARENELDEAVLRDVIERVTGQRSTAAIPKSSYDALKKAIVAEAS